MNKEILLTIYEKEIGKVVGRRKSGKIINISSNLGKRATVGFEPYSCVKVGAEMLTKILVLELKLYSVAVNSFSPSGSVEIEDREFGVNTERESPEGLVKPLMKLCTSKITG
ncbi:SDR family NAD(P)-dependent oxidoreductase [Candidatus Pacearchaeota archaeon]|nr:SDR family NAD(P)-dependent oxidoreductase [Candidatus Pacearchaeota archaeon]